MQEQVFVCLAGEGCDPTAHVRVSRSSAQHREVSSLSQYGVWIHANQNISMLHMINLYFFKKSTSKYIQHIEIVKNLQHQAMKLLKYNFI